MGVAKQCGRRRYAYRKLGDWGRAAADYERALAAGHPGAAQLHTNRAYCLAKLGRYAEALDSYALVLRANPANTHALHNRCVTLGFDLTSPLT